MIIRHFIDPGRLATERRQMNWNAKIKDDFFRIEGKYLDARGVSYGSHAVGRRGSNDSSVNDSNTALCR